MQKRDTGAPPLILEIYSYVLTLRFSSSSHAVSYYLTFTPVDPCTSG